MNIVRYGDLNVIDIRQEIENGMVTPLYARPIDTAFIFGISLSSVNRIVKEWRKQDLNIEHLMIYESRFQLINIKKFESYLIAREEQKKKHLKN